MDFLLSTFVSTLWGRGNSCYTGGSVALLHLGKDRPTKRQNASVCVVRRGVPLVVSSEISLRNECLLHPLGDPDQHYLLPVCPSQLTVFRVVLGHFVDPKLVHRLPLRVFGKEHGLYSLGQMETWKLWPSPVSTRILPLHSFLLWRFIGHQARSLVSFPFYPTRSGSRSTDGVTSTPLRGRMPESSKISVTGTKRRDPWESGFFTFLRGLSCGHRT